MEGETAAEHHRLLIRAAEHRRRPTRVAEHRRSPTLAVAVAAAAAERRAALGRREVGVLEHQARAELPAEVQKVAAEVDFSSRAKIQERTRIEDAP